MFRFVAAAALVAAAAWPLPAAASAGTLPSGVSYIVDPIAGPPVATVELWFRAPAAGFGATPLQSLSRLASEAVASSKPLATKPLGTYIAEAGGRLSINAYSDSVVISATVPASRARDVVATMTRAFFAPVLTDLGFAVAQRTVASDVLFAQFDPDTVLHDAVFAALFSAGPHALPPLGAPQDVQKIKLDDVRAFAERAFRAQNAVLVVSGAVDPGITDAAADARPPTPDAPAAPEPYAKNTVNPSPAPVRGTFPDPLAAFGWTGPPIASEREATALDFIADYLFRPESGTVAREVDATQPDTYVTGQFVTLHDPGVFIVTVGGKHIDDAAGRARRALAAMQTPLSGEEFRRAIAAFVFHMQSDQQTTAEVAENQGWYAIQGNAAYAPSAHGTGGAYAEATRALSPDFVAKVAATYLHGEGLAVNFVPKAKPPS